MPDVNYELTADMEEFFKTGVLPTALQPQDPVEDPVVDPTPEANADPVVTDPVVQDPVTPEVKQVDPNPYLEQMLASEKARVAELDKQFKALQDQIKTLTTPKAPDPTEDPLGHLLHKLDSMAEQVRALQEQQTAKDTQNQQLTQQQQFQQAVHESVQNFSKDHPDYQQAYNHLRNSRSADLMAAGYTRQEVDGMLNQEEFNVALRAMQTGKNPAEVAYQMAKRLGYQAPAPKTDPESKVAQIRKGMEAAKGVPEGKPSGVDVNIENLSGASDADLNKIVEGGWEKLFGQPDKGSIF